MIELLDYCGSDNAIANTARVSMEISNGKWTDLPAGYEQWQSDNLIGYLAKHNHSSPFRHNSITLRCNVPIFLARQLGKHQVGMSWNEVSRRYVDTGIEFYHPDKWRARPVDGIKQGSSGTVERNDEWKELYEKYITTSLQLYEGMVKYGIAPEMARIILPQSMMTQFIWTGSLMAFAHVYKLRIDGHAQVEAQEFAKELDKVVRPLFPVAWAALVGETDDTK